MRAVACVGALPRGRTEHADGLGLLRHLPTNSQPCQLHHSTQKGGEEGEEEVKEGGSTHLTNPEGCLTRGGDVEERKSARGGGPDAALSGVEPGPHATVEAED